MPHAKFFLSSDTLQQIKTQMCWIDVTLWLVTAYFKAVFNRYRNNQTLRLNVFYTCMSTKAMIKGEKQWQSWKNKTENLSMVNHKKNCKHITKANL